MTWEIPLDAILTEELENTLKRHGLKAVGAALIVEPCGTVKRTHEVKPGDKLGAIAKKYNVLLSDLIHVNNIENPHLIHVGQILEIP